VSAFNVTAADYADLLEDDCLSSFERSLYESELRRALKREAQYASIDASVREATATHVWLQRTLRVARDLLALQWEVAAWERNKHMPYCYDDTHGRMQSKRKGFMKRLANLRKAVAEGNAQKQKWMEDHAELIAAVEGGA